MHRCLFSCWGGALSRKTKTSLASDPGPLGPEAHLVENPSCTLQGHNPGLTSSPRPGCGAQHSQGPIPWESMLMEFLPMSLAIVTSDAKEVLYEHRGLDPAAAQQLEQALQYDSSTSSFLASLLGPELEKAALDRCQQSRFWKGAISVKPPMDDSNSISTDTPGGNSGRFSPSVNMFQILPASMVAANLAAGEALFGCAKTAKPAQALPKGMATDAPGAVINTAGAGSAPAAAQGVAVERASAAGLHADGRAAAEADVWVEVPSGNTPDAVGASDVPACVETAHAAPGAAAANSRASTQLADRRDSDRSSKLAKGAAHLRWSLPHEIRHKGLELLEPSACSPLPHDSSRSESAAAAAGMPWQSARDLGTRKGPEPSSPAFDAFSKPPLPDDPAHSRPATTATASAGQHTQPLPNWRVKQQEQPRKLSFSADCPEEAKPATASQALPTMSLSRSYTSRHGSGSGSAVLKEGGPESKELEATFRTSQGMSSGSRSSRLRKSKSISGANHFQRSRKSSLLMTQEAIEHFIVGNDESMTRTVALLKSLSQQQAHRNNEVEGLLSSSLQSAPSVRRSRCKSEYGPPTSPQLLMQFPFLNPSSLPSSEGTRPQSEGHGLVNNNRPDPGSLCTPSPPTSDGFAYRPKAPAWTRSRKASGSVVQSLDALESGDSCAQVNDNPGQQDCCPIASEKGGSLQSNPSLSCQAHASTSGPALVSTGSQPKSPFEGFAPPEAFCGSADGSPLSAKEGALPKQGSSFDVFVCKMKPMECMRDAPCPLLVVICNSSEHLQVQATLSTLAESQLELLSSIMPQHAIQFLAMESTEAVPEHVGQLARAHTGVTLMFMDICGFTAMSKNCSPTEVMIFLNTLFSHLDHLTDVHGVHKVETAGDCYIVSGGIMSTNQSANGFSFVVEDDHHDPVESAKRVMTFAKALLETARQVRMPDTNKPVAVRVGLHTGDVVTGLIGSKLPKFSIFGDTMNTASRMESTGVPGRIHASAATHALLRHEQWEPTGGVEVKGKGQMQTFLWVPPSGMLTVEGNESLPASDSPCTLLEQAQSKSHGLGAHLCAYHPTQTKWMHTSPELKHSYETPSVPGSLRADTSSDEHPQPLSMVDLPDATQDGSTCFFYSSTPLGP